MTSPLAFLLLAALAVGAAAKQKEPFDARCVDPGPVPESSTAQQICDWARRRGEGGVTAGWTLVVTTYKGHGTLRNTVQEWARSGLLRHPDLRAILLHINHCSCGDSTFTKALFAEFAPGIPLQLLCLKGNRLHPQALLVSFGAVNTSLIMFAENDRPTMQRTGETEEGMRLRVRNGLDVAVSAASDRETPFVLIHRFSHSAADQILYWKWLAARAEQAARGGQLAPLPTELTLPHQHPGDATHCWRVCFDFALAHREGGSAAAARDKYCAGVLQDQRHSFICDLWVCREWEVWRSAGGTSGGVGGADDQSFRSLMCHEPWLRDPGPPKWMLDHRLVRFQWNASRPDKPQLTCTKSAHWVNAPAIFLRSWYLDVVAGVMCKSPAEQMKSGLVYKHGKSHFGHYGKKMEQFLIRALAGRVGCHVDGITEHIELEDFLRDRVG